MTNKEKKMITRSASWRFLVWYCNSLSRYINQVNTLKIYFHKFSTWCDLTRFCLHLDGGGIMDLFNLYCKIPDIFGRWRNFGSIFFNLKISDIFGKWRNFGCILIVLHNSWLFWMLEKFWIYFICTAKSLTFLDLYFENQLIVYIFKVSWLFAFSNQLTVII